MAVEVERPSTWLKYRSGMCDGCWAGCCTLPVEASVSDLLRLELITEDEAMGSLKKVAKRLMKEGLVQHFTQATQLFVLEQRYGRDCIFLGSKDRLCTVYEKRPEVCRRFPKIGPRPGWCPSFAKGNAKESGARASSDDGPTRPGPGPSNGSRGGRPRS